jgi:glutaminyl-peptide cyclotransferase
VHPRRLRLLLPLLLLAPCACSSGFPVDGARAHARVVHQVAAGPRIPGTPGHAAILEWIAAESARLGGRVERQAFVDSSLGHPLALMNVIARFGPREGRRIALCAHWDTRPFSDQDPDSAHRADPVPGANDAGSGVAVLLEMAELMHQKAPPIGVDLVFFDGEDQGEATRADQFCFGAHAYAARLPLAPDPSRPVAGFLFDMVGDRELSISPEIQSAERAANLVDLVLSAARATGATHFHPGPRYSITDDHIPLLEAGVPAVDIIDFDYPAWHTHRDLPDQVSAESLAEVSRVAAWLIYRSPLAGSR